MESILSTSSTSATYLSAHGFSRYKSSSFLLASVSSSSSSDKLSAGPRKLVIAGAKQNKKNERKDSHSFVARPDEATGIFPEAVLLKEKKVQEDGKLMPEFADADEEELFEYLNLQLESGLNVTEMRHYEVVYLIHEQYEEEVVKVNEKIEAFLAEKKGKVWRFEDWGMRRLAYKIKKATKAHYILMNFEVEGKWINEFKTMLDKEERVIRHLVIKKDDAVTKVEPPPPEFYTLRSGFDEEMDDDDEEEDDEDDDEEDEDEDEDDGDDDGIILVTEDDDEEEIAEKRNSREAVARAIKNTVKGFPRLLLNLSAASLGTIMDNAFGEHLHPPFDPYANSLNFLLASYVIPYVGLTGYVGANPKLKAATSRRVNPKNWIRTCYLFNEKFNHLAFYPQL